MFHPDTRIVAAGRTPERFDGLVNTPVFRGSTMLSKSFADWEACKREGNAYSHYGRFGTPTTRSLETAIAELEGGHASLVFPSGLSACTHTLLAFLASGDHVLITDNVYGPVREFADKVLSRLGIQVGYFDPQDLDALERHLQCNTRAVFVESPGSLTFEVSDIPAIAERSHAVGARLLLDNTWASPLYFKPFEHGADVSLQAATKYIVGHSDALLGIATASADAWEQLRDGAHGFGETAGPEDVYLASRGLRSMAVRLHRHWQNGMDLAQDLKQHPAVLRILHPARPEHPDHALWKRDFLGASGLFGVELKQSDRAYLQRFFDALRHFGIGLSWGGYESLALPVGIPTRSVRPWPSEGYLIRIHAGLEDIRDLQADLHRAFDIAAGRVSVGVA